MTDARLATATSDELSPALDQSDRPRYHALDALRAWAMFLGIVLHAALPYVTNMDRTNWGFVDPSQDATLDSVTQWIHAYRMELFYMISGFFGCMVISYRGHRYFIQQRVKKLLIPFVVCLPMSLIAIEAAVVYHESTYYGYRAGESVLEALFNTLVSPEYRSRFAPSSDGGGVGTTHLWFLYYLMMFAVTNGLVASVSWRPSVVAAWRRLVGIADWILASPWRILLPSLAMIPLVPYAKWVRVNEAPTNLVPHLRYYTYYGFAYLSGYLLYANRHRLETLKTKWGWYAVISAVGMAGIMLRSWIHPVFHMDTQNGARRGFALGQANPETEFATAVQEFAFPPLHAFADQPASVAQADLWIWVPPLCVTLTMLASCLALFGIFLRFFNRPSSRVRYWSDSAYFLYIFHLPVTMWIPSLLLPLPWHGVIKFALTTAITTAVGLFLYEYCVRYTFIGTQLNGTRSRAS